MLAYIYLHTSSVLSRYRSLSRPPYTWWRRIAAVAEAFFLTASPPCRLWRVVLGLLWLLLPTLWLTILDSRESTSQGPVFFIAVLRGVGCMTHRAEPPAIRTK